MMNLVLLPPPRILAFLPFLLLLTYHSPSNAEPDILEYNCTGSSENTTEIYGTFQTNLNLLLFRSMYNEGGGSRFYSGTSGEYPDKVYGLFICRVGITTDDCDKCIDIAIREIVPRCPSRKSAMIWYTDCFVRYSDASFFSIITAQPQFFRLSDRNVSDPNVFNKILLKMFKDLVSHTAFDPSTGMYLTREANISDSQKLYGFAQCTPDLSPRDCSRCLEDVVSKFVSLSISGKEGARLITPSCNLSGYMAPEYAMEGLFSVKSDVFSFGVILLEIISGKKTNGFYNSEHGQSLLMFVCFSAILCFNGGSS
ncbi:hypothetical protein HHK36_023774 [Tetracentron sinense]|uniref:Gnk2-homologous domain-containing protein n=1 Tax=Tetracentron sinense TaxID=13715 RepID=A0A834YLV2_TETSI|nr:hypothetical protein HHK36_023774 [Tetracentron sinense]